MARTRFVRRERIARRLRLLLLVVGLPLLTAARSDAATQTRTVAGTITDAGSSWDNDANAGTIDNACAQANGGGGGTGFSPIDLTSWGFAIPVGATITGVEVVTDSGWNDAATADAVQLLTAPGSPAGAAKAVDGGGASASCGGAIQRTHGAANDLWGAAWSVAQINAAGFGVRYDQDFANSALDGMTVTVHYCTAAPDLAVAKSNSVAGATSLGSAWTWRLDVANTGSAGAAFLAGQTILSDALPAGPAYGAPTVGSVINVTNSGNISCAVVADLLTCTANGATVTLGATTGAFRVSVVATPATTGTFTNGDAACAVDPAGAVAELDENDNACNADAVVVTAPDLTAVKSHDVASPIPPGTPWNWRLDVANGGGGPAAFLDGQTILTDTLPAGPVYGAPAVGSVVNITNSGNISCGVAANVLTCSASGATVTVGATTGAFRVTLPASSASDGSFVNPGAGACAVDPGGALVESNEANNGCGPDGLVVAAPVAVAVLFDPDAAPPGASISELEIALSNPNGVIAADDLALALAMPAGLELETGAIVANTCGATLADANPDTIAIAGTLDLAPGASCTLRVPVSAAAEGDYPVATGPVTSSTVPPAPGAGATLRVALPLAASKAFDPPQLPATRATRLVVTITNPSALFAATGVAFSDPLPSGLRVALPPNETNSCGGTFAPAPGASLVELSGGSLAPGASCQLGVDLFVAPEAGGTLLNVADPVTADGFPSGNAAEATLEVEPALAIPALDGLGLAALALALGGLALRRMGRQGRGGRAR